MGENKRKKKDGSESSDSDIEQREKSTKIKKTNDVVDTSNIPEHVNSVYISLLDPAKDIKKFVFALYKQVSGVVGEIGNSRVCRDNKVWVEVLNKGDLVRILKMKTILNGQEGVKVEPALNIGISTGIIYAPEVLEQDVEDIKQFAKSQYDIINITRLNKGKEKTKTPLLKIVFGNTKIPEKIRIGFQIYDVRIYYPPPQRCYECYQFGHFGKICRNGKRCVKCGEAHPSEQCTNPPKCINCGQKHTAIDVNCEKFKQEKDIVKIKIDRNISFKEARNVHNNLKETYKTKLMTNVTKDNFNKDIEEINETFVKEVKKIEKHITPDIKKEIQSMIQNTMEDIIKKITTIKQIPRHHVEKESSSPQFCTTETDKQSENITQVIHEQDTTQTFSIRLNNGNSMKVTNQKANISSINDSNGG